MDLRQSPQYAQFMSERSWVVEKISPLKKKAKSKSDSIYAFIRKIPFIPLSVMKIQRFEVLPDFEEIKKVARKYRSFSITLEPDIISGLSNLQLDQIMTKHGYKKGKEPFQPTKTVQVDLKKSEEKILFQMKKDARASFRKAKLKCKAEVLSTDDLESINHFYCFWKKNGKGYIPSQTELTLLLKTFKKNAFIVVSSKQDQFLAGALILLSESHAYYYYAVTSPEGRKDFAGYLVVWEAMLEAKRLNCSVFDFEGIFDTRFPQLKRWKGFSQFKQKFGGKVVTYPGVFSKYLFPF